MNGESRVSKKIPRASKKKEMTIKDPNRLRCQYFIERKNRQCNLTRRAAEIYCPEHLLHASTGSSKDSKRTRIACPLDPNHSVWKDQVKHHITKCQKRDLGFPNDPWFKLNCNVGNNVVGENDDYSKEECDDGQLNWSKWVEILNKVYSQVQHEPIPRIIKQHKGLKDRLQELENQKHAIQQSSLIGHMDDNGIVDYNKNNLIIEFGCGRAELSRYLAKSLMIKSLEKTNSKTKTSQQRYLLIDRAGPRNKLDGKIIDDYETDQDAVSRKLPCPIVRRIKIDIKDLRLDGAIESILGNSDNGNVVAVSKHLCGCATDLTLTSLTNSRIVNQCDNDVKFGGLTIALCCRQLCTYETYNLTGRQWLQNHCIDREGFKVILRMTSWAVCGSRRKQGKPQEINNNDNDNKNHASGLNEKQRFEMGLKARRIIDYGRILGLRHAGFTAQLVEYVDSTTSLENVCLIATKS